MNFEINEEDLEDFDGDRRDDFNNICALGELGSSFEIKNT